MRWIVLLIYFPLHLLATSATWNITAAGNWNVNGNWTPATFPNAIDDTANFLGAITANRNITLGQNITVGSINFDNSHNYTITGANTLSFQTSSGNATLTVTTVNGSGAHSIAGSSSVILNNSLTLSTSSSADFTISADISGAGGITQIGSGTGSFILNSANTYGGATSINSGNLTYNVDGSIPTGSALTVGDGVSSAATFTVAATMSAGNALTATINSNGTIIQNANRTVQFSSLEGSGAITASTGTAASNLINISGTTSTTFSGSISGGAASASANPGANNRLIKADSSTLTLTGDNSAYVSRIFIAEGIIDAKNGNALGPSGNNSATYVRSTSTVGSLYLENSINLPKTLFLNGPGVSSTGALRNLSGNNTVSGPIQIGWSAGAENADDAIIQVDPGTTLSISNVISGANVLTKTGTGTLIYNGTSANTLTGATNVNAGTLNLNLPASTNGIAGNVQINTGGTLFLSASEQIANTSVVTLSGGTFNLNGQVETIGSLVFNSGTLTQGGATLTLNSAAATALSVSDGISIPGNLTFGAAGGVIYTGTTTTASISGDVNLGTFAHTFNIGAGAAAIDLDISGVISGSGSVTQSTGAGVLQFSGGSANTYGGTTTINAGELHLNKTAGVNAIAGNITLNGGILSLGASEQIANTATLTIAGGTFSMGANTETIDSLTFTSGTFSQSAGGSLILTDNTTALSMTGTTLSGSVTLNGTGSILTNASASTATISGSLNLNNASGTTFNITNGSAPIECVVSAAISGVGGVTKITGGALQFTGGSANTYSGLTTVSAGTFTLAKTSGINAIGDNLAINGGTLALGASEQIPDTATVTIGGGIFNLGGFDETIGTLIFSSGTYTPGGGTLTLSDNTTVLNMVNSGNLTISGPLVFSGSGAVLFTGTSGTATLSSTIDLGGIVRTFNIADGSATNDMTLSGALSDGGVLKLGAGRLSFTGASPNTYAGLTTVTAGELRLGKTAGVTAIAGDLLINGGLFTTTSANQLATTTTVTVTSGGQYDPGNNDNFQELLLYSGAEADITGTVITLNSNGTALYMQDVALTGGTITLSGTGGVVFDASNNGTATINNIALGAVNHTFDIGDGTASSDMIIGGVVSGVGGGLTKIGNGRLELAGTTNNTYTGLTTVSAGDLLLNKTGGNAIPGNVLINGGNLISNSANRISNTATVTMTSGTFNLSDFSEAISSFVYNGGSLLQGAGVLTLSNGVTALSMQNTMVPGSLILSGGGAVVFDASNNGTAVLAGDINLSGSSTTFNIGDGSADIDMSISGAISNGSLIKSGAGKLVLTGLNSYAGGTTINTGTLQGDANGLEGNIVNNAHLVFDLSGAGTYAGMISGPGTFTKQGSGALTLTSTNTIDGASNINAGNLIVDGFFGGTGSMNIAPGAQISGIGTIAKDLTITGILSPGNSIGTIHFIGNQTLATGSTLINELDPTSTDLVDIVGNLTIQPGTTLNVITLPGTYMVPRTYTIIQTTTGVTGKFSTITNAQPLFAVVLDYSNPDLVLLRLFPLDFCPFNFTGNAGPVACCLDNVSIPVGSDLANIINDLRLLPTLDAIQVALDQMQPSQFTSLAIAQQDATLYLSSALSNRLDQAIRSCPLLRQDHPWLIWADPMGAYSSQQNQQGQAGFRATTPGLFIGADQSSNTHCVGLALGYSNTNLHWKQEQGLARIQTATVSLYGRKGRDHGYIEGMVTGGYSWMYTQRDIHFIGREAIGHHNAWQGSASLKGAVPFRMASTNVLPYAAVNYQFLHEEAFTERGAGSLSLNIQDKNSILLVIEGGLDISHCFSFASHRTLIPFLQLSAIREIRFLGKHERASFSENCCCVMTVSGLNPTRTLGSFTAGINGASLDSRSFFSLFYQGKYGSRFQDQSLNLQFGVNF